MKTHLTKRILALLLTLIMVLSLMPTVFADEPEQDLAGKTVILHTNDTHGALRGFAQVAAVKTEFEERGANVILVDAGDFSQGTTYVSLSKGATAVRLLNAAGYDFITLGNHEFDFGYAQLMQNLSSAEFQALCADVFKKDSGESILPPCAVKEIDGLKLGFFGMETPETQTKVNPGLISEIEFGTNENGKFLSAAESAVAALKAEGAELVIGIVHLGVDDESEPYRSVDLFNQVEGIDFLIDGHSHTVMTEGPNGEPIQSTGTKASAVSLSNVGMIQIDNATKSIEKHELIPLDESSPVDETVAALAQEIMDAVDEEYGAVFARSEVELNGDKVPGNRNMETNLGDLITDALLWGVVKEMDAETLGVPAKNVLAITNGGGIRAWIHAGDVTMNDVNTVLPFGNTLAVVYVTGAELLEALEASTAFAPGGVGGFPQVSGIEFTLDTGKPFDEGELYPGSTYHQPNSIQRVSIESVNGKAFDPAATYAVVTNNFCAAGGDTYYAFKAASSQFDTGLPMDEVLMEYIKNELKGVIGGRYAEPQGRIRIPENYMAGKTVILHTNDTHGALRGFAQAAKVKKDFEAKGANVILVDAGDYSQGNTYVSTSKGATAIEMMNAAGYSVATLGNHEFDFGYPQLMQNLASAEFEVLCADVFNKETGDSILPACTVREFDGLKLGFFGMETPETQTKVNPGLISEIEFGTNENGKFLSGAQNAIAALKAEGVDLIIGLVHLGVDPESEPYRSVDLYNEIKDDVDFLIDGHSHTVMLKGPNGEPIQSTGTKASDTALMNLGCIVIDNASKTIEDHGLIHLGEDAPADMTVAAQAQEIMDQVDEQYGAVFAQSLVELNGDKAPGNRNMETNLGDLITDSMVWSVMKDMDAETLGVPAENVVAVTNGGGIRAWIHKGDVTMNDVHTVLPFGNTIAVVYVSGAELLEALEASTYCTPGAVGGFPQVSGIKYTINTSKTYDKGEIYPASTYYGPASIRRVTINEINGQAFDPEATYAVVTNNFCAAGGDTYYAFVAADSQFDTGIPLDEALMEYITEELDAVIGEEYAEPQGRITVFSPFDDVQNPDKYYYEPVYWAYNHEPEITSGITPTTFGVKKACTREQIVAFLYAAAGKPEVEETENPFKDVKKGKWYYNAVMWAVQNGITGGVTETRFGIGDACTRAQAVTFIYAFCGKPEIGEVENPFTDVKTNKWFYDAVMWAVQNGVTSGTSATTFSPNATCTRAQIVTFLYAALGKEQEATVRVFETTDIHGYLLDTSSGNEDTFQYRLAYLAQIFNDARASKDYDDVLLLDGGDIYQGTPASNLIQGAALRAALDKMGYDAVSLGNHEFDWGVTVNADAEGTIPAYEIGKYSGDPDIPILAANLYYADSGERVNFTQDYTVVQKAGYRIAIIGYIPNYRGDIKAAEINPYTIDEDLEHLAAKVKEVKELERPDVTIILAHDSPRGIAEAMDPADVDLVVGGHSHSGNAGVAANGIAYIQGNCQAKGYASANLVIQKVGVGKPTVSVEEPLYTNTTSSSNRPNLYDTIDNQDKLDQTILEISHIAWDTVKDAMNEVLGYTDVSITKNGKLSDNGATVAGNWISGLMLRGTADLQPVAAFYNSGGIRTSLDIPEGQTTRNITVGDIYTINPFGNSWLVYEITGPEMVQQLINGFRNGNFGDQMSGLTFTYWKEGSGRSTEYGIVSITLSDGTAVDLKDNETTYRVCVTDYSATLDDSIFQGKEPVVPMADAPIDNITEIELLRAEAASNNGYIAVDTTGRGTLVEKPETGVAQMNFPSTDNADIEKYGNIFTDMSAADFFAAEFTWGDLVTVKFLDQELELPIVPTYSYVDQGNPAVIVGKDGETGEPVGRVKMAINMGDFATTYGLAFKTTNPDKTYYWTAQEGVTFPVPVTVEMKEAGGYMAELLLHDINRTNNREDYPNLSDEEFANFRQITTTGMGDHLYRGSSPINPEIGRNTYADAALRKANVSVIMNLANDQTAAEAYPGYADTYYAGQNIIFLNLGVDFQAADFQAGLANGLRFFAENQGVYYVHCTEGKDRAGFVSALLECLMGATYDEVVADYLKTYTNYYTVVDGVQQPLSEETLDAIANSNIIKTLQTAFAVSDLKTADLAAEAEAYIAQIGLSDEEIAALKANLAGETAPTGFRVLPDGNNMLKYGHIDLDVSVADFLEQFALGDIVTVTVNGYTFDAPVVTNYDDVDTGAYLVRCANGKDVTTLAINYGQLGVAAGIIEPGPEGSNPKYVVKEGLEWPMFADIEMKEAGGYADELSIRKLTRTNVRSDYDDLTDAEFANFRSVTTTGMGENVLYRSSSPIDPDLGRNTYADAAAQAAGIKVFVNLADTQEEAEAFEGYTDSYYSTQTKIFLGLPVAFTSEEFKSGLADGYRFIASNEGPYLIHCLEGKDRTGLSVGVLECLMGASLEEIQADYLKTYENYFEVQNNEHIALTEAQETYLKGIITKNLGIIFGVEDMTAADLTEEADAYLAEIGLTAGEIATLKEHLSAAPQGGGTEPTGSCYEKVTEAPADWTEGTYILVYETEDGTGKVFNGNDGANGDSYTVATINDGVIAYDEGLFTVTFETMEGGYAIHTANGYMGNVGNKNGVTTSSATAILNTLTFSDAEILLISNDRYFRFNTSSGNDRFRYFNRNTSNDKYPIPAIYVLVNAD